jgi:hypothetical protein
VDPLIQAVAAVATLAAPRTAERKPRNIELAFGPARKSGPIFCPQFRDPARAAT